MNARCAMMSFIQMLYWYQILSWSIIYKNIRITSDESVKETVGNLFVFKNGIVHYSTTMYTRNCAFWYEYKKRVASCIQTNTFYLNVYFLICYTRRYPCADFYICRIWNQREMTRWRWLQRLNRKLPWSINEAVELAKRRAGVIHRAVPLQLFTTIFWRSTRPPWDLTDTAGRCWLMLEGVHSMAFPLGCRFTFYVSAQTNSADFGNFCGDFLLIDLT